MAKEKKENTVNDLPGVGAATAEKLAESGFDTILAIAVASIGELTEASGMNESAARKLIFAAREKLSMGFETGLELLERRKNVLRITTSSKEVDRLLGGGVESGSVTEFYGPYASGKSAVAHQLAVNVQLPLDKGGYEGVAVFLDTESTFRPERIKSIAEAHGMDPLQALKNIRIVRCFNSDHQMLLAEKVADLITKDHLPVKILIVDSLMSFFRAEYIGRGTLAERQQKLNKHIHTLQKLADTYNIAVYVTNQVMAKPDTFFGDPTEAIGGHILAHGVNPRIYVRKGKKGTRVAKLIDSSYLPEGEVIFRICEEGIRDEE